MDLSQGLMEKFLQPEQKHSQDTKDWNQQPPCGFPPQLKPRPAGLTAKRGRVKIQPAGPTSVPPSCSSTGVVETNPESSAVSPLVRRGRGWGSRLGGRRKSPHGRRRQFHCSYCEYASVRRYNTERHIRLRHPTYRYKCPLEHCGQILLNEAELRIHLEGHSGAAFFLQCRECGLACGDYNSFVSHQSVCGTIQGGSNTPDRPSVPEEQGRGESGQGHDSSRIHEDSRASDNNNAEDDVHLNSDTVDNAGGEQQGGAGGSDDENSVEVVEEDNLPVHFMVKEEMAESPASSS